MASFYSPKLLRAKDPIDLFVQVQKSLANGDMDLHGSPFVDDGILCQWVEPIYCFYEYRLIQAVDTDDLEKQVIRFAAEGFGMFGHAVQWSAKRLQWLVSEARQITDKQVPKKVKIRLDMDPQNLL